MTLVCANDDGRLPIGSSGLSKYQCKDASPTFKLSIKMLLWSGHEFKVHAIYVIDVFIVIKKRVHLHTSSCLQTWFRSPTIAHQKFINPIEPKFS
jgi:hypothetical protein